MVRYRDDRDGKHLIEAVVEALSQRNDKPPAELTPLYHSIDLEALAKVFSSPSTRGTVAFEHEGQWITITHENNIYVVEVGACSQSGKSAGYSGSERR